MGFALFFLYGLSSKCSHNSFHFPDSNIAKTSLTQRRTSYKVLHMVLLNTSSQGSMDRSLDLAILPSPSSQAFTTWL